MILSVSRRTDIPAFYSDWFFNRIKAGFLLTRNPMNYHQVSKIDLSPDVIDCIVFWTKDPTPMIHRLHELKAYPYYFQVSLTPYEEDVELKVPNKDKVLEAFIVLSKKIGPNRMVWRYDPIIFTNKMDIDYHTKQFRSMAKKLKGYTDTCVISFVDHYLKIQRAMVSLGAKPILEEEMLQLGEKLARIASDCGIHLKACSEPLDMSHLGIEPSACTDQDRIEAILHKPLNVSLDHNQRQACTCVESVDIGAYHSCHHGCVYCYATDSYRVHKGEHSNMSPMLIGDLQENDVVKERKMVSLIDTYIQMTLE